MHADKRDNSSSFKKEIPMALAVFKPAFFILVVALLSLIENPTTSAMLRRGQISS